MTEWPAAPGDELVSTPGRPRPRRRRLAAASTAVIEWQIGGHHDEHRKAIASRPAGRQCANRFIIHHDGHYCRGRGGTQGRTESSQDAHLISNERYGGGNRETGFRGDGQIIPASVVLADVDGKARRKRLGISEEWRNSSE